MKIGGVQKSLLNLLWELGDGYDITLYLFCRTGAYVDQLPNWVKVQECTSLFQYLGVSQGEGTGIQKLLRGLLALLCKLFRRETVLKLLLLSQKILPQDYDYAVSFLHNGGAKSFYGGVQEFVLHRVKAKKKIAFLHCDHRNCGGNYSENNASLKKFDVIAACSEGCRQAFLEVLPELKEKCVTVRNCHRFEQIRELANQSPAVYDSTGWNLVMISRLSHEKGIERAIEAVQQAIMTDIPVTLHLVGSGGMETQLRKLVQERKLSANVRFYGEQENPYRYMKNADLLLMTSFHEAAPMVIEEAGSLGLPVLTTRTTSSDEMVLAADAGWVCENDQKAINQMLQDVLKDGQLLKRKKETLLRTEWNNAQAIMQFKQLIGEENET